MAKIQKCIDEKIKKLQDLKKKQEAKEKDEIFKKVFGKNWKNISDKIIKSNVIEIIVDGEKI